MNRTRFGAVRLPLLGAAVLASFAVSLSAQVVEKGRTYADLVATHPCNSGNSGRLARVTDAQSSSSIGGGGGSVQVWAVCDGVDTWTLTSIGAAGGVDLSPYVLLAGDADGQTIQGVAGSNKPHLSLGDTYVSLRASTDGTDETLSFLNVGATGVEIDVHDGVAQFQMNDNGTVFTGAVLRMNGMTVPTTASDPCFAGAVAWDSGFWYVCIALDTWKRTALSTW